MRVIPLTSIPKNKVATAKSDRHFLHCEWFRCLTHTATCCLTSGPDHYFVVLNDMEDHPDLMMILQKWSFWATCLTSTRQAHKTRLRWRERHHKCEKEEMSEARWSRRRPPLWWDGPTKPSGPSHFCMMITWIAKYTHVSFSTSRTLFHILSTELDQPLCAKHSAPRHRVSHII